MSTLSKNYWVVVIPLTAIYAYAFLDRLILALMVDPIRHDLGLSDVQMGLLLGIAFALFYGVLNLPAGFLVDRVSRRGLIGAAAVIWSLMTAVCGLAGNFAQLFLGRAGVGVSEAVITPASYSLILATVPPEKRGLVFSVYAMAPVFGGALALIGGGVLYGAAQHGAFQNIPLLGTLHPWQAMLVIVGVAGLPMSLLLLLFREPARQQPVLKASTGFQETGLHLRHNAACYVSLVAYVTTGSIVTFGQSAWLPAIFGRNWHLPISQIGTSLGLMILISGFAGLISGGIILNRLLANHYDIRIYGLIAAIGSMAGFASAPLMPNAHAGLLCAGIGMFFASTNNPIAATTLAELAPPMLIGKITAIYQLMQIVFGQALAPVIIALVARSFFTGPLAIGYGFSCVVLLSGVGTVISALALRRALLSKKARKKLL